jgi:hypothetical protein
LQHFIDQPGGTPGRRRALDQDKILDSHDFYDSPPAVAASERLSSPQVAAH